MSGAILFAACSASKEFPQHYKGEQIHFGQGGGFTGAITHYALMDDGRIFQKPSNDTSFVLLDKWEQDFVRQMFKNYHQLALDKINHYHPGNLYYFIEHHQFNEPVHRISWGQSGHTPDENVITFYNLLYRNTKAKS